MDWVRTDKQNQVVGYGDTGRHGAVRHGNVEQDNTISLIIEGRPPRNEEDTPRVCATLAAAMSCADEQFTTTVSGDRDIDGALTSATRALQVQVVKALAEDVTERSNAASEERLRTGHAVGGVSIV